jgi:hypothetical protein
MPSRSSVFAVRVNEQENCVAAKFKISKDEAGPGGRLLARHESTAVVMCKPVNHALHLLLTICSIGIWAPVWLLITAVSGQRRQILTVDQYGQVSQRRGQLETYRKVMISIAAALFVLWFVGAIIVASTTCVGPPVAVCVRSD